MLSGKPPDLRAPVKQGQTTAHSAGQAGCGKCEKAEFGTCGKLYWMLAAFTSSTKGGHVAVQL